MGSDAKEIDTLIGRLLRQGWRLVQGRHRKLVHPSGKGFVAISRSPSDYHALDNIRADVRRLERKKT